MKKKKIFLALIASSFIATAFTSCGNSNNNETTNNLNTVETNTDIPNTSNTDASISDTTDSYEQKEDLYTQKVYNEFLKLFPNDSYNDFLKDFEKIESNDIKYTYKASSITLDSNGEFKEKEMVLEYNNSKFKIQSKYANNNWIDLNAYQYINNEFKKTEEIKLDSKNSYKSKFEYTYDNDGNMLFKTRSTYVNNDWIVLNKYQYINNKSKEIYTLTLNSNNMYEVKEESTFDDSGNFLTYKISKYIDDEWVVIGESKAINNKSVTIYKVKFNVVDNSFDSKTEYKYDDNGNETGRIGYIYQNNEWLLSGESTYINNKLYIFYKIYYKEDNTFNSKEEYTYDNDGNMLTETNYRYLDNMWKESDKYTYVDGKQYTVFEINWNSYFPTKRDEYKYDDKGKLISFETSIMDNDTWKKTSKEEYTYDNDGYEILYVNSILVNDTWEKNAKSEYIYEDGKYLGFTAYVYINGECVKTKETRIINGESKNLYELTLTYSNEFVSLMEYTYDNDGNMQTKAYSKYINNEWAKIDEYVYINGEEKVICKASLNSNGSLNDKYEYTYDNDGNMLTKVYSKYINNEWVKLKEYAYYNNEEKTMYSLELKTDGSLNFKYEYVRDDEGNTITEKFSKYVNNAWLKMRVFKYFGNISRVVYDLTIDSNYNYKSLEEYTYDNDGNYLTGKLSKYIKNTWVKLEEYIYFDNVEHPIYELYLDDNNLFDYKFEYEYNLKGDVTTKIYSEYKNEDWVNNHKTVYTYDDSGNKLTEKQYEYVNNDWLKSLEYKYLNNERLKTYHLTLDSNNRSKRLEQYTYNDSGKVLTEQYYEYESAVLVYITTYTYTYDSNGNRLSYLDDQIDRTNNLEYHKKFEYAYYSSNNRISEVYSEYKNNTWVYVSKYVFTYDSNNNRTSETRYIYKDGGWVEA